jgi:hypothetical protein
VSNQLYLEAFALAKEALAGIETFVSGQGKAPGGVVVDCEQACNFDPVEG